MQVGSLNLRESGPRGWLLSDGVVEAVREVTWLRLQAYPSGPGLKGDVDALTIAQKAAW